MVPKTCSIPECELKHKAHGLCKRHYEKLRREGQLPAPPTPEARFWGKVDKAGDCWTWAASKNPKGYGYFSHQGKCVLAHRFSYEIHKGSIPDGLIIDHTCHNRACVKPGHLRAVTNKQNEENRAGASIVSSTGLRGVGWHKETSKWRGFVMDSGKYHHVGLFACIQDAEKAVIAKRNELFTHNDRDRIRV